MISAKPAVSLADAAVSEDEGSVVVLQGHPDPGGATLCHALADAYSAAVESVGVPVKRIEVAQLEFPLLRTKADFNVGSAGTPPSLCDGQADIVRCKHLAIFYPLWMGTMPALLKGYIEQVFRPDVALADNNGGFPKQLMKGKSARVIVTMGMPVLAYRWYFGAHSLKSLQRNILRLTGFKPVDATLFGSVDTSSPATKKKWFQKTQDVGQTDARSTGLATIAAPAV